MDDTQPPTLGIKAWAAQDRPREKLLLKGQAALSDAELLAIIVGSGSRNETAVSLCQRILKSADQNLNQLGKLTLSDLQQFKGIGEAKAIAIIAALELGRRRQATAPQIRPILTSSQTVYDILRPILADLPHEEFWVLYLNRSNKIITKERLSAGGVTGTVTDSKILFKKAIQCLASSVIISHNHPSGSLKPSEADIKTTKKLVAIGAFLEIPVLDHLIVTDAGYYSFADEGMI